jgi:hypothetical protein
VSYRHSSYRKMSRSVAKALEMDSSEIAGLPRHEMNRVLHWSNQPPLPKPEGWGAPRSKRRAA